ncbi:hypothetical protein KP509_19G073800 [Ceratopteris richardii]|uniref:GOLD domain-containing protein n=1 Tax=Ceratopteris richardii TaxID=49495 RepID=A0A8T2SMC0_CERRI|nr:hypothetical protein KP509_19G073800 [Ceratopteris richardii]KAH7352990.1 hypothetical protein KP509_19G073800 [Ceratopteris richardii]
MAMLKVALLFLSVFAIHVAPANAVRVVLSHEECFYETVEYDGDLIHVSFVVIRAEHYWNYEYPAGIDLTIEGPNNFHQEVLDKASDKLEFTANRHGSYKFCLKNNSPYSEMVDFSVHVGHIPYYDQKVQDDHINPLMTQIAKLQEAVYSVHFEQHWLYAQTEQQAILNNNLSRRLVHRAVLEAVALVAVSVLQVYLLRRLFDRKLNLSRV